MATTIALRNRLKAIDGAADFSEEELAKALAEAEAPERLGKTLKAMSRQNKALIRQNRELAEKVSKVAPYLMPMDAGMVEKACSIMAALHDLLGRSPEINVAAPYVSVPMEEVTKGLQGLVEALGKAQGPTFAPQVNVPLEEVSKALGGIVGAIGQMRVPKVNVEASQHKIYVPMAAVAKAISDLAVAFKQMPAPQVNPIIHVKMPRIKRMTTVHKRDGAGELKNRVSEYEYMPEDQE